MEPIASVRIRQKTIVQQVMENIRELVASGKVRPGDRLPTELELARTFGVSRSSIREAIKIFSYLGVFETLTRRGTVLRDHSSISDEALSWTFLLGEKDFDDLIELRKAIEQEAWSLLADARTRDPDKAGRVLAALKAEVAAMRKAILAKSIERLEEADFRFHEAVIDASGNGQYIHLFRTLESFTREDIRKSNLHRKMSMSIVTDHARLVGALERGDEATLRGLFRRHIEVTKRNVNAVIRAEKSAEEARLRSNRRPS